MNAIDLISMERTLQIGKGFTAAHDDCHVYGELSEAAAAYASVGSAVIRGALAEEFPVEMMLAEGDWPEDWEKYWKPSDDPIRNLVKAGALIVAEIERLQRLQLQRKAKPKE